MTEQVLTTLITAGQAVTLGLIGLIGIRLGKVKRDVASSKRDAAAARYQVENDHIDEHGNPINMRVENDSRHAETKRWLDDLKRTISGQIRTINHDIGGIREELRDDRRSTNRRFDQLEARISKEKP